MKYDYRMEEEAIRMLTMEGTLLQKREIAEMLGVSEPYLDKFLRALRKAFDDIDPNLWSTTSRGKHVYHRLRRLPHVPPAYPLIWFYRMNKNGKPKEYERMVELLRFLAESPKTKAELMGDFTDVSGDPPDARSLDRYLSYLLETGAIMKYKKKRGFAYAIDDRLLTSISDREMEHLYLFTMHMANASLLSVPGFLLSETLREYLIGGQSRPVRNLDVVHYRNVISARILDEYKVAEAIDAMAKGRMLSFRYYAKAEKQRSRTRTETRLDDSRLTVMPLSLVYDHQFSRMYLLASDAVGEIRTYKLEGIAEMEEAGEADKVMGAEGKAAIEQSLSQSWLLAPPPSVKVRMRFYFERAHGEEMNFMQRRVLEQGGWGRIVDSSPQGGWFDYEIDVNGTMEIKPWIRSFGASVEVLEPSDLRSEMKEEWNLIWRLYADAELV